LSRASSVGYFFGPAGAELVQRQHLIQCIAVRCSPGYKNKEKTICLRFLLITISVLYLTAKFYEKLPHFCDLLCLMSYLTDNKVYDFDVSVCISPVFPRLTGRGC